MNVRDEPPYAVPQCSVNTRTTYRKPVTASPAIAVPFVAWLTLVALALPRTQSYDCTELASRRDEIEKRDRSVAEGHGFWLDNDQASYCAMTLAPLSNGYLARRQPYTFRLAAPLLAYLPVRAGIDFTRAYFALAATGLLVGVLFVFRILELLQVGSVVAATGATVFLLSAKATAPLLSAHEINAGSLGLLIAAWYYILKGKATGPTLLLALAVLWHETAILSMPAMALQMALRRRHWVAPTLLALLGVAAFAVPRALIQPTNSVGAEVIMGWVAAQLATHHGRVAVAGEYLQGLGVALALAPFGMARLVKERLWPMLLVIVAHCGTAVGLEIGRLIVPASVPVIVCAALAINQLTIRQQAWTCAALVAAATLVLGVWRLGQWSSWALVMAEVAMALTYVQMRNTSRAIIRSEER